MIVIVTLIYDTTFSPFIAHIESTVTDSALDGPIPTHIDEGPGGVAVICHGGLCIPMINFARPEVTDTGALDGPTAITRVIAPVTTSTAGNGAVVTLFNEQPSSGSSGSGSGSNNGGSGSGSSGSGASNDGSSGSSDSGSSNGGSSGFSGGSNGGSSSGSIGSIGGSSGMSSGSSGSGGRSSGGGTSSNGGGSSSNGGSGSGGQSGSSSGGGSLSNGVGSSSSDGSSSGGAHAESASSSSSGNNGSGNGNSGSPGNDNNSGGGGGGDFLTPLIAHVESTVPVTFFAPASEYLTQATVTIQGLTLVASAVPTQGGGIGAAIVGALQGGSSGGSNEASGSISGGGNAGSGSGGNGASNAAAGGLTGAIEAIGGLSGVENGISNGNGNSISSGPNSGSSGSAGGSSDAQSVRGGSSSGSRGSPGSNHGGGSSDAGSTSSGSGFIANSAGPDGSITGDTGFAEQGQTSGVRGSEASGNDGTPGAHENAETGTSSGSHAPPVITIGTQTFAANSATQFNLGSGQTLKPGGVATIHGTTVSLGPSASFVVVNGATATLSSPNTTPPPVITIGSRTFVPNAATQFFLAPGQTLSPGGVATISGTTVSLAPNADFVVLNGHTETLPPPAITPPPILLIAGTSVTANAGTTFSIDGQALTPGGKITVDGTTVSLGTAANVLVVNGVTLTRPPVTLADFPTLTIGGQQITPIPEPGHPGLSEYVVNGKTLVPGVSALTIDGTTVSLLPSGAGVVINGATTTFSSGIGPITSAPVLTIDGTKFSALPGGTEYNIDGQTLTPGGVITVHGETISLSPRATILVVDGKTITLFPATGVPGTATQTKTQLVPAGAISGQGSQSTGGSAGSGSSTSSPGLQGAASKIGSSEGKAILVMMLALFSGAAALWWM